ncbi:MAG: FecR family protein [Methylacidiphilales bacterium]|nr:FecR family protein [Candidatus Methylacidiphilales bacterium]
MNTRFFFCLLAVSLVAVGRSMAADQVATVTVAVNDVDHGSSQSTASSPATKGTKIHDGEYVKTGDSSRAELQFSNNTISRLGSNTIFNYSASANQVNLESGTILFSKPKDGQKLNIKTEAVTAAIVGTTGFFNVSHHNGKTYTLFGIIEGHANVTAGGSDPVIGPGDAFLDIDTPGQPPQIIIFNFNINKFWTTSNLVTDFSQNLPNESYILTSIQQYLDNVHRGFIVDTNFTPSPPSPTLDLPYPTWLPANDSAGNGLNVFNASGLHGPPVVTTTCCHCCCCWCCRCCCCRCCCYRGSPQ